MTDRWKEGQTDGRTDRGKTVYPPPVEWGYTKYTGNIHVKISFNRFCGLREVDFRRNVAIRPTKKMKK